MNRLMSSNQAKIAAVALAIIFGTIQVIDTNPEIAAVMAVLWIYWVYNINCLVTGNCGILAWVSVVLLAVVAYIYVYYLVDALKGKKTGEE